MRFRPSGSVGTKCCGFFSKEFQRLFLLAKINGWLFAVKRHHQLRLPHIVHVASPQAGFVTVLLRYRSVLTVPRTVVRPLQQPLLSDTDLFAHRFIPAACLQRVFQKLIRKSACVLYRSHIKQNLSEFPLPDFAFLHCVDGGKSVHRVPSLARKHRYKTRLQLIVWRRQVYGTSLLPEASVLTVIQRSALKIESWRSLPYVRVIAIVSILVDLDLLLQVTHGEITVQNATGLDARHRGFEQRNQLIFIA